MTTQKHQWIDNINWNDDGLVPAIAQDYKDGEVLTLAWMNREALYLTVEENRAVYWSRSRKKIWRKGEDSGHKQIIKDILLDCDADSILLKVEQIGGIACHTGRKTCFYQKLENHEWKTVYDVIKDPKQIYQRTNDHE